MEPFENNDELRQDTEVLPPQEAAPEITPPVMEEPASQPAPEPVPNVQPESIPAAEPASQTAEEPVLQSTAYRGTGAGRREAPYGENGWTPPVTQPTPPRQGGYAPQGYYQQPRYQQPQGYYQQNPYRQGGYQQPYQNPYQQPRYQQPQGYYPQQGGYVPRQAPAQPQTAAPQPPKKKHARKGGAWKSIVAAILILALVGGSCFATASIVNKHWQEQTQQLSDTFSQQIQQLQTQIDANVAAAVPDTGTSAGTPVATGEGLTPAQVYARNVQSVVAISCTVTTNYYGQSSTGTSTGSGFILSEDGYVVTNYHVVEGATSIKVTTNDGTSYTAQLMGGDSTNDVAVLKVETTGLPAVTIGSSHDLIVGDQVVAIGNPLGELTNTLTVGYVSAKDRMITTDGFAINMLQTDASINSGNSGGPLFNMKGEVVGITTAKYSGASSSGATIEGIGFAIPINDVFSIIDDLINFGYVTGAYLGVSVSDMDATAAAYYGLPVGAYVQEVTQGYAAERAGLQAKDIIVAVGEYEINGVTSLTRALRNFKAGDTTTITIFRSGVEMVLNITLDEKPVSTPSESTEAP